MRADPLIADFGGSLESFYEEPPPEAPPSWWYENGGEPIFEQFAALVASMLGNAPRLSKRYLKLDKDGYWFERHFTRLANTAEETELVRVMFQGEKATLPAGTEAAMDASTHFTEAVRCAEIARWLAPLTREQLSDAAEYRNDPEHVSWTVDRLGWARERLEALYDGAARAENVVLSIWA